MHRAIRPAAMMLVLLLIAVVPAQAGSLRANDVVQVLVTSRSNAQLRLRAVSQTSNLATTRSQDSQNTQSTSGNTTTGSITGTTSDPTGTDSPIAITQDPSTPNVQTIELGDITGTVCDCGEIAPIPLPGGGFPLYPLFALGAIPLAFLNFGDDEVPTVFPPPPGTPTPPATPTPTPTEPIPEPATLLLLGTGLAALGAKVRRRRRGELTDGMREQNAEIIKEV